MKIAHILAKSDLDIMPAVKKALPKLPRRIGIVTTIQHLHKLDEVMGFLESNGLKAIKAGQILGCDAGKAFKIKEKVDAFLYIGSGNFHPIEVAIETKKKVISANPFSNTVKLISKEDIEAIEKRERGALVKFLSAEKIGILVTTKPGQKKLKQALSLKSKLEKKGKKAYIFISDTLNLAECENFNFIQAWVNTACPRIVEDKKGLLNYEIAEKNC